VPGLVLDSYALFDPNLTIEVSLAFQWPKLAGVKLSAWSNDFGWMVSFFLRLGGNMEYAFISCGGF
jgi:hypothetical protein